MSQKYNTYNVCYQNTCNIFYYKNHLSTSKYENASKMLVNASKKSQNLTKIKYFGTFLTII